ncbi:SCP2 sterol-binding domain-containing protein [Halalkalibacter krulwichiae]|uniref:SCP-2 sterol transfer family protein n=1 Tax=Halalkalibacter krulwichiae TaxID=199441 RepID=A0A1X9MDL1_9BACI|nr:SCP2 sterol-binding domain-containing protein [Halalkalibacter krulwichiae]ARK30724.1 SCP-2 sterol transfer family protein [Halalkalibacter krulwichiae]
MSSITELNQFITRVNANPEHIQAEKDRIFQLELTEGDFFQIQLKEGKALIHEGTPNQADVSLKLSRKHLSKLLNNDLNATMAFMTGQLKVDGKVGLALKLQEIVKSYQSV